MYVHPFGIILFFVINMNGKKKDTSDINGIYYFSNNRHQHFKQKIHKSYCYLCYLSVNLYTIANVAEVHNKGAAWHICGLSYRCETKQQKYTLHLIQHKTLSKHLVPGF